MNITEWSARLQDFVGRISQESYACSLPYRLPKIDEYQSEIPPDFYITEASPLGKVHRLKFPASNPIGREQAVLLCRATSLMLMGVEGKKKAKSTHSELLSDAESHSHPPLLSESTSSKLSSSSFSSRDNLSWKQFREHFESVSSVISISASEIARQEHVECHERGLLTNVLKNAWIHLTTMLLDAIDELILERNKLETSLKECGHGEMTSLIGVLNRKWQKEWRRAESLQKEVEKLKIESLPPPSESVETQTNLHMRSTIFDEIKPPSISSRTYSLPFLMDPASEEYFSRRRTSVQVGMEERQQHKRIVAKPARSPMSSSFAARTEKLKSELQERECQTECSLRGMETRSVDDKSVKRLSKRVDSLLGKMRMHPSSRTRTEEGELVSRTLEQNIVDLIRIDTRLSGPRALQVSDVISVTDVQSTHTHADVQCQTERMIHIPDSDRDDMSFHATWWKRAFDSPQKSHCACQVPSPPPPDILFAPSSPTALKEADEDVASCHARSHKRVGGRSDFLRQDTLLKSTHLTTKFKSSEAKKNVRNIVSPEKHVHHMREGKLEGSTIAADVERDQFEKKMKMQQPSLIMKRDVSSLNERGELSHSEASSFCSISDAETSDWGDDDIPFRTRRHRIQEIDTRKPMLSIIPDKADCSDDESRSEIEETPRTEDQNLKTQIRQEKEEEEGEGEDDDEENVFSEQDIVASCSHSKPTPEESSIEGHLEKTSSVENCDQKDEHYVSESVSPPTSPTLRPRDLAFSASPSRSPHPERIPSVPVREHATSSIDEKDVGCEDDDQTEDENDQDPLAVVQRVMEKMDPSHVNMGVLVLDARAEILPVMPKPTPPEDLSHRIDDIHSAYPSRVASATADLTSHECKTLQYPLKLSKNSMPHRVSPWENRLAREILLFVFLERTKRKRASLIGQVSIRKLAVLFIFNKYGGEEVAHGSLSKFAMLLEGKRDKDIRLEIFARFLSAYWKETVLNVFFAACALIGDGGRTHLMNMNFMVQDMDIGLLPFFMLLYDLREMGITTLDPNLVIDQFGEDDLMPLSEEEINVVRSGFSEWEKRKPSAMDHALLDMESLEHHVKYAISIPTALFFLCELHHVQSV